MNSQHCGKVYLIDNGVMIDGTIYVSVLEVPDRVLETLDKDELSAFYVHFFELDYNKDKS